MSNKNATMGGGRGVYVNATPKTDHMQAFCRELYLHIGQPVSLRAISDELHLPRRSDAWKLEWSANTRPKEWPLAWLYSFPNSPSPFDGQSRQLHAKPQVF